MLVLKMKRIRTALDMDKLFMNNSIRLAIIGHVEQCLELLGKASCELEEAAGENLRNSRHIRVVLEATIKQTGTLLDDLYSAAD